MSIPRLLVAGTHSGAGKTAIATGIMAAMRARGLRVQGFKVGPDFIDPTFHQAATGRPSRNLDGWMCSRETNIEIAARASRDADAVVIEGVMGLFDGAAGDALAGTSAEIAMWLDAAVVLVVDAAAMAGSIAAVVHGYETLIPGLRIAAVIPNRVAGARHYDLLREAVEARCHATPVGYVQQDPRLSLPERHLGLHLAHEVLSAGRLAELAAAVEAHLDLDRLLEIASRPALAPPSASVPAAARARIGIARDEAFCFYYQDNLDLLDQCGAELIEFSPISDRAVPPDLDGLYFGGGYPEVHAEALSGNAEMLASVRRFAASGRPVYAECGGFMYLTEGIEDIERRLWPMAGVFPTWSRLQPRLAKLGYIEIETSRECGWLAPGMRARGHEFRYSAIDPMPDSIARAYTPPANGYRAGSVIGSYVHLHFLSCPGFAERFVAGCCERARAEVLG